MPHETQKTAARAKFDSLQEMVSGLAEVLDEWERGKAADPDTLARNVDGACNEIIDDAASLGEMILAWRAAERQCGRSIGDA